MPRTRLVLMKREAHDKGRHPKPPGPRPNLIEVLPEHAPSWSDVRSDRTAPCRAERANPFPFTGLRPRNP